MSLTTRLRRSPVSTTPPVVEDDGTPKVGERVPGDDGTSSDRTSSDRAARESTSDAANSGVRPRRGRQIRSRVATGLALLLVMFALIAPNRLEHLTPGGFLRIPVEGLLYAWIVLVLPDRVAWIGRALAVVAGLGLGLLTVVKLLDLGFYSTLNRPFDALLDFPLAGDALGFLTDTIGETGAIGVAIGVGLLIVVVLVLMTLSVRRLSPIVLRNRTASSRTIAVLGVAWVTLAVLGVEILPYTPVASRSAAAIAISHIAQIPTDLKDGREFNRQAGVDAFQNTPGDQLLTGLRGKDVVVAFVESYGRSAIESPDMAPQVDALLDAGSRRLRAAGFDSRSGFLTSPTSGGGSWLAQSTLMSGLWVKNQSLYNKFIASNRLTLTGAFKRADWRTLAVAPGVKKAWPEARVFEFDKIYDAKSFGYRGPRFAWSWVPDQFVLSAFERTEHSVPNHTPMMVEMPLTSSHMPWTPLPKIVDWNDLGDGSIFAPMSNGGQAKGSIYGGQALERGRYRKAIEYSLSSLISYVQKYGDDNLVLVFLGDHQPIPLVAGKNASHDVPITIVAKDPAVLKQISGWGWQRGLNPGPKAPVWRMDTFRDRFLTAFGSSKSAGPDSVGSPPHPSAATTPAPAGK